MNWLGIIASACFLAAPGLTKMVPIIDENYEICTEPEESANKFDYSELEIIVEEDTAVFLNGKWKFKNEVKSPWMAIVSLEKFDRGQWNVKGMYKKIEDFCQELDNPLMPWYVETSKFKNRCPFPAGSFETFDMVSLTDLAIAFPQSYEGQWRFNMYAEFPDEGNKKECMRVNFYLVDK